MAKKKKDGQGLLIGFDLGGTKLASGIVTSRGKVLASRRDPVHFAGGPKGFLAFLTSVALAWKKEFPKATALGVASCGPLDVKRGILMQPTNFPRWGDLPVAGPLSKKLRLPVIMQNDAAAAAAAEGWVGGAKKLKNWMTLTLGTGLGTGVVIGRELFMGGSGFGPEAGHMILTDKPYRCGCGNLGCAEAVLSGTGLRNRIEERRSQWQKLGRAVPDGSHALVSSARGGDPVALEIFDEYPQMLARAIHNYSILFNPDVIFFSGGLSDARDLFLPKTKLLVEALLEKRPGFFPKLQLSELGPNAGIVAGAWVAWSRFHS